MSPLYVLHWAAPYSWKYHVNKCYATNQFNGIAGQRMGERERARKVFQIKFVSTWSQELVTQSKIYWNGFYLCVCGWASVCICLDIDFLVESGFIELSAFASTWYILHMNGCIKFITCTCTWKKFSSSAHHFEMEHTHTHT